MTKLLIQLFILSKFIFKGARARAKTTIFGAPHVQGAGGSDGKRIKFDGMVANWLLYIMDTRIKDNLALYWFLL